MVEYKEGERKSVRGHKLFTVEYYPKDVQLKAVLVFHHGLAEHVGRYADGAAAVIFLNESVPNSAIWCCAKGFIPVLLTFHTFVLYCSFQSLCKFGNCCLCC